MQTQVPTPYQVLNNPELFAAAFLRILDKNKNLVPFRWNKTQRHFHEHRTGRDLILKARQVGFSTYIQAELFRRLVSSTRTTITLAHDTETTQKMRRMADRFWEHCRFNEAQPARKYANSTVTTYPEFDSTSIIATAGNVEVGRGDTYTDLHGSEVAFWPDAERIIAGAMQGGNPDVVLESTPNGAQGYFYELCMDALEEKSIWTLHFYPWWWHSDYWLPLIDREELAYTDEEKALALKHDLRPEQIKWRRHKQKELRSFFSQEYPEDPITCFLTSINSYFGDISCAFHFERDISHDETHTYVAGLDWGMSNDYTSMRVMDKTSKIEVDKLYVNQLPWAEQRRRIADMYRKWDCKLLSVESNSIGGPNIEALEDDGLVVDAFAMTNMSKQELMADLYEAIHTDGYKFLDDPVLRHEMQSFSGTQTQSGLWRLAASGTNHDDTVIAAALAIRAAKLVINPVTHYHEQIDWRG